MNTSRDKQRIGVMGGTFDPIHYGHLVTAEAARCEFRLDEVIFVPAGQPPHKSKRRVSPIEDRYAMSVLATVTNPHFSVSPIEMEREGPSYTIDTLTALKKIYGQRSELFFITGVDAILEILSWKNPEQLLTTSSFVAASRPGYSPHQMNILLRQLPEELRQRIIPLQVPALAISSSDLRQRVADGRPIKYLLPEAVESYIHKAGLYVSSEKV